MFHKSIPIVPYLFHRYSKLLSEALATLRVAYPHFVRSIDLFHKSIPIVPYLFHRYSKLLSEALATLRVAYPHFVRSIDLFHKSIPIVPQFIIFHITFTYILKFVNNLFIFIVYI